MSIDKLKKSSDDSEPAITKTKEFQSIYVP